MASFAFTDGKVTVNAVDLSAYVRKVTINTSADQLDNTAMGAAYRSRIGGLKDWSVNIEFNNDFALSAVDATLWPLLDTVVTVTVKSTSAANSTTNPQYSGPVLVSGLTPIDGGVGDLATTSVTWQGAGTLTRLTS